MTKKVLGKPRIGLRVATTETAPEGPPSVYSMDAILKFAQDVVAFDKQEQVGEIFENMTLTSSLVEIQSSAKKSPFRLRATAGKEAEKIANANTDTISTEVPRLGPPLSGHKGQ